MTELIDIITPAITNNSKVNEPFSEAAQSQMTYSHMDVENKFKNAELVEKMKKRIKVNLH